MLQVRVDKTFKKRFCKLCRNPVTEGVPCVRCGSKENIIEVVLTDGIVIWEGFRMRMKDFLGVDRLRSLYREKISHSTKLKAREWLLIDRLLPLFTRKAHKVQEQVAAGVWEDVHSHENYFPAGKRTR